MVGRLALAASLLAAQVFPCVAATRLDGNCNWEVATSTDFDTDYFTLRLAFRQDAVNKGTHRLASRQGATYWILWLINGNIRIETNHDGGITGATDYSDGLWHEVVFTRAAGEGGWLRAYVDGTLHLDKSVTSAASINPTASILIGGGNRFIGDLDHFSFETAVAEDNPEVASLRSDRGRRHATNQYTALRLDFWDATVPTTVKDRSRLGKTATQSGIGFAVASGPPLTAAQGGQ